MCRDGASVIRCLPVILTALALLACDARTRGTAATKAGPVLITALGSYASPNGTWAVTATRRSRTLVDYTITDTRSGAVLAQGGGFSDAQRWFLYWDADNRLWTHNSDMGPFGVWIYDDQSRFELHEIAAADPLLDSAPPLVLNNLPNSIKRYLQLE